MKHTDIGTYIVARDLSDFGEEPETFYVQLIGRLAKTVRDYRDATRFDYEEAVKTERSLNHHNVEEQYYKVKL